MRKGYLLPHERTGTPREHHSRGVVTLLVFNLKKVFMQIKLAEALLRRKELQQKVDRLKQIQGNAFFEVRAKRVKVTDDLDDVVAQVPLMTASQVTHEYDWHAKQLRLVDAAIQQANWTTMLETDASVMADYVAPEKPGPRGKE